MKTDEIAKNLLLNRSCDNCSNRYDDWGCADRVNHTHKPRAFNRTSFIYYQEYPEERICERWTQ